MQAEPDKIRPMASASGIGVSRRTFLAAAAVSAAAVANPGLRLFPPNNRWNSGPAEEKTGDRSFSAPHF